MGRFVRGALVMVVVLAAMAGNAAHKIYRDHQDTQQRHYSMVRDMARLVDDHVRHTIHSATVALDQTAAMVAEAGGPAQVRDLRHWARLRDYAAHVEGVETVWIFDADGQAVLDSASFPNRAAAISRRTAFQELRNGTGLYICSGLTDRVGPLPLVFSVSRPLHDDEGRFVGVAAAAIRVDHLTNFYDLLDFDLDPLIGVYRPDGEILARHPATGTAVGRSVADSPLFRTKLREAPEGQYLTPSVLDGTVRIVAYRTVQDYGLVVLTGIGLDEAMAEWRARSVDTVVAAVLGLLAVLAALAWGLRFLDRERKAQVALAEARSAVERTSAERDESARLAAALDHARDMAETARQAAEAANRAKGEFLAGLSHELRTPLNAVIGFADLIAREAEGPVGTPVYLQYAGNVRDSGQHVLELINEILDHARAEAGALRIEEGPTDLEAAADFALRMLTPRAERAGVRLSAAVAPAVRRLRADDRRLRQILLNLVANAVKYTPAGGSVAVCAVLEDGQPVIRVTDTGLGIPAEDVDRVMEPFVRIENAAGRRVEGVGLGLPLTKRLVELHGGRLELRSSLGIGTTVTVRLPPDRLPPAAPPAPSLAISPGVSAAPPLAPPLGPPVGGAWSRASAAVPPLSILLADDDPTVRGMVMELLGGWGHRVTGVANANEALVVLAGSGRLDLLISDVVMPPGMDGTELARQAVRMRPGLPVLLASGFAAHAVADASAFGPDVTMIAKPFSAEELLAQLSRIAALRGATADPLPARPAVPPAVPPDTASPRLLIAEDLAINRELLAALFRDSGYRIDLVGDGAAAVEAVREADYDLVLMDVHMPVMDGLEACRAIRAMPPPRNAVPVLALTAGSSDQERRRCREAGMDGYIGKPYDRDTLMRQVARSLSAGMDRAASA
ncbi:signal transduction histidine kinase/CheY-like chemotaxis protein [Azospirillum picis]|uniref:histidine kinase n=1 Tax=Azospirillum picis TaxID=488438 RepID=A0ABU0MCM4_9PROT|nr:signal transduction histidine kinase/CheY-like chemotaxis protein [Azospirillum picis]MDQ0531182.1 signal transduction histidine kinase/CheY-like chemotaxis protein [Azospirillum picis]